MIPFAVVLYSFEIWVLSRLLIETSVKARSAARPGRLETPGARGREPDHGFQTVGSLSCGAR